MTREGPFYVQMYGGYVESLGIILDSRCDRQIQLHDEAMSDSNQPANISVFNRR